MSEIFKLLVYDDHDEMLKGLSHEQEFSEAEEAVEKALDIAHERYRPGELKQWRPAVDVGNERVAFYEPGQPGNVVVARFEKEYLVEL